MIPKSARWRVGMAIRPCCCAKSARTMTLHSDGPWRRRAGRVVRARWTGGVLTLALVALTACGAGAAGEGAARPAAPVAGSDPTGALGRTASPAPAGANEPAGGSSAATSPSTPETVKVAFAVRIGNAPLFLAQEQGFFAEQ